MLFECNNLKLHEDSVYAMHQRNRVLLETLAQQMWLPSVSMLACSVQSAWRLT